MRLEYSRRFKKEIRRAPNDIQIAFRRRLDLFLENQFHPLLNNHSLSGELKGCHSINITGDWRAVYEKCDNGTVIFFQSIGTHSQLYK